MLLNISGVRSNQWDPKQREAAIRDYGGIIDLPFPNVPPTATKEDVAAMAGSVLKTALAHADDSSVYMVKGEFSLAFAIITELKALGKTVVIPASERWTETISRAHHQWKVTRTKFVAFRET